MHIETKITIHAGPDACWEVLGRQFGDIGAWATAIIESRIDREPGLGAMRVCTVKGFGGMAEMDLHEELIQFDPAQRRLAYQVNSGLPGLLRSAENHWSVDDNGDGTSTITSRAQVRIAWYMAFMTPLIKAQMRKDLRRLGEELTYRIERGTVHPRKVGELATTAA